MSSSLSAGCFKASVVLPVSHIHTADPCTSQPCPTSASWTIEINLTRQTLTLGSLGSLEGSGGDTWSENEDSETSIQ